jgi:hypothetical protein
MILRTLERRLQIHQCPDRRDKQFLQGSQEAIPRLQKQRQLPEKDLREVHPEECEKESIPINNLTKK